MPSDDGLARSAILETRTRLGYGSIMRKAMKVACQKPLDKIEGQVHGLSRMVDEDRYCIDIVTQVPGPVGGAVIDEDLPCGECCGPAAFVEGFGCRPLTGVRLTPAPASESLQRTKPRWGADGGAAGTMGIWPQRLKRWDVGEAMDGKGGWLADAPSGGCCGC
jgi:hypothetical protein